jgi:hypothetical protein
MPAEKDEHADLEVGCGFGCTRSEESVEADLEAAGSQHQAGAISAYIAGIVGTGPGHAAPLRTSGLAGPARSSRHALQPRRTFTE